MITVVGLHGGEPFGRAAADALVDAEVVVAAPRHREQLRLAMAQEHLELAGPLHAVLDQVEARAGDGLAVVVVASGDPGFFGIVRMLGERFGTDQLVVHPAPSSVALAFGRIGTNWDDAVVVSAHGRPVDAALDAVTRFPKVAVLTAPQHPPELLGKALLDTGCPDRSVAVATRLGEAGEAVTRTDLAGLAAGTFDPMSVVVFLDPTPVEADEDATLAWGLAEQEFDHRGGLITKSEVRAVALGKLALPRAGVLWDVGAGSGSVGIECARLAPRLRVIAIERNAEDAERIRANAKRHGVAVEVVVGSAPEALADLPTPDRVFVGGGGMDVVRVADAALRPGGTIVATHVLVDRAAEAWALLGDTTQVATARAVPIADGFRLDAQNPVFVSWGTR
ncbi:precorrin-6y C5,15-methyltransferase (decarboxylating) subunit CbiE [Aquihabitans daechungensis]|uniref:precorrin-6y C5,15-methyltransferase (decarboxylating) subunit CbiE n=1 Tax=Aquihabitans daechungensis TaxID=1052257 RepID=UPI003B9F1EC7